MVDELTLSFNSSHGPKITEFSWIAPQTKSYRNYQGADFHTSGLIRKLGCVIGKLKNRSVYMQSTFFLSCCCDEISMHANMYGLCMVGRP